MPSPLDKTTYAFQQHSSKTQSNLPPPAWDLNNMMLSYWFLYVFFFAVGPALPRLLPQLKHHRVPLRVQCNQKGKRNGKEISRQTSNICVAETLKRGRMSLSTTFATHRREMCSLKEICHTSNTRGFLCKHKKYGWCGFYCLMKECFRKWCSGQWKVRPLKLWRGDKATKSHLSSVSCLFSFNALLSIHDGSGTMFNVYRFCTRSPCLAFFPSWTKSLPSGAIKLSPPQQHGAVRNVWTSQATISYWYAPHSHPTPALDEVRGKVRRLNTSAGVWRAGLSTWQIDGIAGTSGIYKNPTDISGVYRDYCQREKISS